MPSGFQGRTAMSFLGRERWGRICHAVASIMEPKLTICRTSARIFPSRLAIPIGRLRRRCRGRIIGEEIPRGLAMTVPSCRWILG